MQPQLVNNKGKIIAMCQIENALYNTVHNFKGGARGLAKYMGMRPGTLNNKVDPECEFNKLSVFELLTMMRVTDDYQALNAITIESGFALLPIGKYDGVGDMQLLDAYANVHAELGDVAKQLQTNLADGQITKSEHELLQKETNEVIAALLELVARSGALVVPDPLPGAKPKLTAVRG